jgi:hypothetical protein
MVIYCGIFLTLAPGAIFTTLSFLCNLQMGPIGYRVTMLAKDKHSSLLGPIVSHEVL